jgi:hypothetical protein
VVKDGDLLVWDKGEILRAVRNSSQRVWESFYEYHWTGKGVEEIFPPSFEPWQDL